MYEYKYFNLKNCDYIFKCKIIIKTLAYAFLKNLINISSYKYTFKKLNKRLSTSFIF